MFPWGIGLIRIPVIFLALVIISSASVTFAQAEIEPEPGIDEFDNAELLLSNGTTDDNTNEEGSGETTEESTESPSLEEIYANLIRISIKYNELYPEP